MFVTQEPPQHAVRPDRLTDEPDMRDWLRWHGYHPWPFS